MKSLAIVLSILGFLNPIAHAELIDGPANIRSDANSTIIARINDGAEAEIQNIDNSWIDVAIFVSVPESSLESIDNGVGVVKENELLYDLKHEEIGASKEKLKLFYFSKGKSSFYSGFFEGKTHKQNIKRSSIPELELQKILKKTGKPFPRDVFDDYIQRFGYKKWIDDEIFKTYILYAPSSLDPSAGARNILVFNNDILLAIIFSKKYNFDYLKSTDLVRDYKISIINTGNTEIVDSCIKRYREIIKNAD